MGGDGGKGEAVCGGGGTSSRRFFDIRFCYQQYLAVRGCSGIGKQDCSKSQLAQCRGVSECVCVCGSTMLLLYTFLISFLESIYRRGARRWRKLYRVNGHLFQAKRFNRVSTVAKKNWWGDGGREACVYVCGKGGGLLVIFPQWRLFLY